MNSDQIQKLAVKVQQLGLNEKEAKVYVASLFLGPSSVQPIAKQAGINRPTAYVILEQLEEKGLVSESREAKKTVYVPEPPEALEKWLNAKEKEIEAKKKDLNKIIPDLKQTHRDKATKTPQVRFYKGVEGIDNILSESFRKAKPKTEVYGLTNIDQVHKIFPKYFKESPGKRVKKNISSKVLYWSSETEEPSDKKLLRKTKKVNFQPKADITLFEDRATVLNYNRKDSVGIVIESKEIVSTLRQLFELAWQNTEEQTDEK